MKNKNIKKQGIEQRNNKAILGGSVGILVVLFMLLQIVTRMTELNAIAAQPPQLPASISQNAAAPNTSHSTQKQMGDDFYKAASGGAEIPQVKPAPQPKPASKPTPEVNKPTAQPQAALAPSKNTNNNSKTTKPDTKKEEFVTVNIKQNVGRLHPFVPAVTIKSYSALSNSNDLPQLPQASYPTPPTTLVEDTAAQRLMQTTISGIMYDAFAPSAIVSVEGQDHLVRKGDRINGYKILDITKDRVIVQNGTNIYRATVGEVLTTRDNVNFNNVYNLQSKFAGANAEEGTKMIEIN